MKKYIVLGIVLVFILIILLAWPKITNPNNEDIKKWNDAGIACLSNGHNNISQHIHPHLQILIDGKKETIPANVGIVRNCMAEVHTHDTSGTVHIETILSDKEIKLGDFFLVWNQSLDKPGYNLEMTVDGLTNLELGNLIMKDKQEIILQWTAF